MNKGKGKKDKGMNKKRDDRKGSQPCKTNNRAHLVDADVEASTNTLEAVLNQPIIFIETSLEEDFREEVFLEGTIFNLSTEHNHNQWSILH